MTEYATLREKIAAEKQERAERYARFAEIWADAVEAKEDAAASTPEIVALNCGFAQVVITPGTSSFARWLVKNGHASSRYNGGVQIFIHTGGQDVDRKVVAASAMVEVLKARLPEGTAKHIYVSSRLD